MQRLLALADEGRMHANWHQAVIWLRTSYGRWTSLVYPHRTGDDCFIAGSRSTTPCLTEIRGREAAPCLDATSKHHLLGST